MAQTGAHYEVSLQPAHLGWGTYRNTGSRDAIEGEGYIPIPHNFAISQQILNSNGTGKQDVLGQNLFLCTSEDGRFNGYLKAQGCHQAGDIYAKQFAEAGNLKGIGSWYQQVHAQVGSVVSVNWVSDKHIVISIVK